MNAALLQQLLNSTGCADHPAARQAMDEARYNQGSMVDALLDLPAVRERDFLMALAQMLSLEWWEPSPAQPVDRTLRKLVAAELALKHRALPIFAEDKGPLHIATCDPLNLLARQCLASSISCGVVWHVGARTAVAEGLQKLYGLGADTFEKILRGRADWAREDSAEEVNVIDGAEDEEASVVRFVNQIIRGGLDQRATDIHIEPLHDRLRIRYRIDGRLEEVSVPENIKALQASVIARLKIMARLDIAERRLPQDGRINLEISGAPIDVRVATIPSVEGESISLRLLGQEHIGIEQLGMLPSLRKTVDELLKLPNGIVLITGPTGSGKSTTLHGFLSELNQAHRRIVTIEDPVEYKIPGVVQIAVKPEIGLTFAAGLRSILRGDPNVVMVGEMRDLETTQIAIRAALTGHLVFSTLHTNDAVGGITRLVDMGVEPFLISSSVRAFFGQRLVRRLCATCRQPARVPSRDLVAIGFPFEIPGQIHLAAGCDACRGTGYQGRLALYEMCVVSHAMQHLINTRAHHADYVRQALQDGYLPMRSYGWLKVLSGETTIEEVLSVTAVQQDDTPRESPIPAPPSSWPSSNIAPTVLTAA